MPVGVFRKSHIPEETSGVFFRMTYNLTIDQEFAIVNNLTLTQVTTLAAFMTLPIWTKTVAIDGTVWYLYSEISMAKDFPLLFGVAKRCYKNITELSSLGFVRLTKLGRDKYISFTEKCANWCKPKIDRNRTESPKTDFLQSENGPTAEEKSPKTDQYTIIGNIKEDYNIKDKNNAVAGDSLFSETQKEPNTRRTSEPLCLFANSRYADFDTFAKEFDKPDFVNIDVAYYYECVKDWSSSGGKKKRDWIATARNFMRSDLQRGCLHTKADSGLSDDAVKYLKMMDDVE